MKPKAAEKRLYFEIIVVGKTIKTRVTESGKLITSFEADLPPLQAISAKIRDRLNKLCDEYVTTPPKERPSEAEFPQLLQNLAREGDSMRHSFFKGAKGLDRGDKMQTLFASAKVTFVLQRGVKVILPWGLMFTLPASDIATLTRAQLRAGFWSERHKVSVMYRYSDGCLHPPPAEISADATKLLSAFHPGALRYADPEHDVAWPHEFDAWDSLFNFVASNREASWLMYFFCHANNNALYLRDPEDPLIPDLFVANLSDRSRGGLVFLNGCQTAVVQRGRSWQEATHSEGLAGCIATEAIVPTRFAWKFGRDFMHLLASGVTPEDAMAQLRQRHWPLSLLYSLYCVPDAVAPSSEVMLPRPQEMNYSALPLGRPDRLATLPFGPVVRRVSNLVRRGSRA